MKRIALCLLLLIFVLTAFFICPVTAVAEEDEYLLIANENVSLYADTRKAPALFTLPAVYFRYYCRTFPGPRLRVPPIDIVLDLRHRQPQPPCQFPRGHHCVPAPHQRSVHRLAEPPPRALPLLLVFLHSPNHKKMGIKKWVRRHWRTHR